MCFEDWSSLVKIWVTFILDYWEGFELINGWNWFGKQHLIGLVVKQEFLFMVLVKWFYLIQQRGEHGMGWMVLDQVSCQVLWHWGNDFFINRLDVLLELYWLISLFLPLFGQLKTLSELFWIFVFKLNGQSTHKLEQTVTQNTNIKLARLFIIVNELNISPNILTSLINGSLPMGPWSIDILLKPFLGF